MRLYTIRRNFFRQINVVKEGEREGGEKGGGDLEILGPGKLCLLVVWLVSKFSNIKFS